MRPSWSMLADSRYTLRHLLYRRHTASPPTLTAALPRAMEEQTPTRTKVDNMDAPLSKVVPLEVKGCCRNCGKDQLAGYRP
jgi:hypothetical protein